MEEYRPNAITAATPRPWTKQDGNFLSNGQGARFQLAIGIGSRKSLPYCSRSGIGNKSRGSLIEGNPHLKGRSIPELFI
jgi:hypothetical protein